MGADMLHLHFRGYWMNLPAESPIDSGLSSWQLLALPPPKLLTQPLLLCLCYSADGEGGGKNTEWGLLLCFIFQLSDLFVLLHCVLFCNYFSDFKCTGLFHTRAFFPLARWPYLTRTLWKLDTLMKSFCPVFIQLSSLHCPLGHIVLVSITTKAVEQCWCSKIVQLTAELRIG